MLRLRPSSVTVTAHRKISLEKCRQTYTSCCRLIYMTNTENHTATEDQGWNDFLPAEYVEIRGGDVENNAYWM